jgi:hypothetical protein
MIPLTVINMPANLAAQLTFMGETVLPPWPQIFYTRKNVYLVCCGTMVYTSAGPAAWTLTAISDTLTYCEDAALEKITNPMFLTGVGAPWTAANWGWDTNVGAAMHTPGVAGTLTQSINVINNNTYIIHFRGYADNAATVTLNVGASTQNYVLAAAGPFDFRYSYTAPGTAAITVGVACGVGNVGYTWVDSFSMTPMPVIVAGGMWHIADLGGALSLYNGESVLIYRSWVPGNTGDAGRWYIDTTSKERTACAFRGRLVSGGFIDSDTSHPTSMTQVLTGLSGLTLPYSKALATLFNTRGMLGLQHVAWASIAKGDNYLDHFVHEMLLGVSRLGHDDEEHQWFLDIIELNERGWRHLPYSGQIKAMLPLETGVVVYGTEGVSVMIPIQDPFPQFAHKKISDVGIAGRGAVAGGLQEHVWLDSAGTLRRTKADFTVEELGYREYLAGMAASTYAHHLCMAYDPRWRDYYITGIVDGSDTVECFMLTESGFCQRSEPVVSICTVGNNVYGATIAATDGEPLLLETDIIDFEAPGVKTIVGVNIGGAVDATGSLSNMEFRVYYRHARAGAWTLTAALPVSGDGQTFDKISGVEFKLQFRLARPIIFGFDKLDYVTVHVVQGGKRSFRDMILRRV